MPVYPASTPPSGNKVPLPAWTKETVPVTDGSERQMGKDSFLLLLLTQLQNQDPMNPMENTEMTAQLAQFSQLEQLANVSTGIETMTGYIQAQNQFQTLSMIGKDVVAENDQLSVTGGESDFKASLLVSEPCFVTVYVVDAEGNSVRSIDMGTLSAGQHDIGFDGKNNLGRPLEDGAYKFQVVATSMTGEAMDDGVYPQVVGRITSVSFDANGEPIIHMGNASLGLGQVVQILDGGQAAKDPVPPADDDDDDNDSGSTGSGDDEAADDTDETEDA